MKTGSKRLCNDRSRDWIDRSTSQIPTSADNHKKLEEERKIHTWCLQRENGPADNLDFGLLASRTEHIIFVVLNHPICGNFS